MAIQSIDRIRLYAMKSDRKDILELLQRRGLIEIKDAGEADEVFTKMNTVDSRAKFERYASIACEAQQIIKKMFPTKDEGFAFLKGRATITHDDSVAFYDKAAGILGDVQSIVRFRQEITEANAELARIQTSLEALNPWLDLPVPQTTNGTKRTAVFVGTLEGEQSQDQIYERLASAAPDLGLVHVEVIWKSKQMTCLYLITLKNDALAAENALRSMGFARPIGASSGLPTEHRQVLLERKENALALIEETKAKISVYADRCADFKMFEDHMEMRREKYEAIEKLIQSKHVFVLDGYMASERAPALQNDLMRLFECTVEIENAGEPGEEVPVLIKNNWFCNPVESVLEGYSMPGKGEIDPTGIMAIFYYIMFGLMFSDAGYGAIVFFVCLFCLLRFRNMEPNWNKNVRMFMWCGLSTTIWGVVFSSYFGDVVDVVSLKFFGTAATIPPLWFAPMDKPMLLLVFSLAIGLIHLTAGYVMKGIVCAKQKDYPGIIYDMVFPITAWYPLVVVLIASTLFEGLAGFKISLSERASTVCYAISAVSIVGILFTGGRESKNWGKRLLKGINAIYGTISGWLSDILSYSRLLALGLATGVIASVMNQLGAMAGSGIIGIIAFLLIFVAGQGLNFGINVLGAYVHSNRLEYVEFFGKFYDGGGRKFKPFGIHTKYYKFEEEI